MKILTRLEVAVLLILTTLLIALLALLATTPAPTQDVRIKKAPQRFDIGTTGIYDSRPVMLCNSGTRLGFQHN